jgi:uncharacterized protein (TIGR00661 family)
MANILYGVNGEGAGHSTRAKEVISHLIEKGHAVHVVSFDRGLQNLSRSFEVTEIYGFRFAYVNNRVRYRKTLAKNLITAPQARASFSRLMQRADEWQIELVCTDFEPLSCYLGHRRHLPVISIDNQHALVNAEVSYPSQYRRDAAAAKLVTRCMTPGADAYLVISFFDAAVRDQRTFLFPPLLRREILEARPSLGDHVLVYVTSPSPDVLKLLRQVRRRVICYGFDRVGEEGNLVFKKPSLEGFFQDLITCNAIIANAGFSLVSEALHLGKPYLAVPVKNQFEQVLNAHYLDKMGYGAWWEELNAENIDCFLSNLETFRAALASYPRAGNAALLGKLDDLIAEYVPPKRTQAASASGS